MFTAAQETVVARRAVLWSKWASRLLTISWEVCWNGRER